MMASPRSSETFARIARLPDAQIDLAEAALVVAAEDAPPVDAATYLGRIRELAEAAGARVASAVSERSRIEALNQFFFVDQGFGGNRDDYYDPRNSYLNQVLDRRTGIPISLAIAYMSVARRLELDVRGVGFPGHFLVKHVGDRETVVDPFFGCILGLDDCRERLVEMGGPREIFQPEIHLRAATHREILVRLLSNLKHIWLRREEFERALRSCERILQLIPDASNELRDRGILYERLGCHAAALADFERFLALEPDAASAGEVRNRVIALRGMDRTLH